MSQPSTRRYGVVVPAYNAENEIAHCLQAIAECDPPPAEIVVVDDCSTDQTGQIAGLLGYTILRSDRNRGAGAARNLGLSHLTTEYVIFIDADIIVDADLMTHLDRFFDAHPDADGVSGIYAPVVPVPGFASTYKNLYSLNSCSAHHGRAVGAMNTSLAAIRTAALRRGNGFDEAWPACEDTILACRLTEAGSKLYFDQSLRMTHIKRYSSVSLLQDIYAKSYWMARYYWRFGARFWQQWNDHAGHHSLDEVVRMAAACGTVMVAIATVAGILHAPLLAAVLPFVFLIAGRSLWRQLRQYQGLPFLAVAIPYHFFEMCVAAVAVAFAGIVELRRHRDVSRLDGRLDVATAKRI